MGQDVFGRTDQDYGGGLSSDSLIMNFPQLPGDGLGLVIQNVQIQYTQPIRRIYELGPGVSGQARVYYVIGRPEGTFQLSRIFGFEPIMGAFYAQYGDPCTNNSLTLSAEPGCNGSPNVGTNSWNMTGVVINYVGMSASAQEMMVQEQVSAMFVSLNVQ